MHIHSAFFYGTLLHPEILKRVIGNTGGHLHVAPAVLLDYTRHHVKTPHVQLKESWQGCDYPAIVPYESAKTFFQGQLTQDERSVRGTVVSGLTAEDLRLLDIFEGDEYTRQTASVSLLAALTPLLDSIDTVISTGASLRELGDTLNVQVYVWADGLDRLVPEIWSFDVFVREKLWRWVGKGSGANGDYAIVDERRALDGKTRNPHTPPSLEVYQLPEFGHSILSQFCFHKDYINLNHGSYGSLPRPVAEACEALSYEVESRPDKFIRRDYYKHLVTARERLAHLIGADTDEVVMVQNTTHGINTVLRNLIWSPDDVIVQATTTYGAVERTIKYITDCAPHPSVSTMRISFPTTNNAILENFKAHLAAIPRKPDAKVVAVIDSISSNPGCLLPWKEMVEICRKENVLSLIDAAHSLGQELDINLTKAAPDFWISDCQKWLYSKRSCAVLYVPYRNQHLIKTSIPTSFDYISPGESGNAKAPGTNFVAQFAYNGTIDVTLFLSVILEKTTALDFREKLGGEHRINEYCHSLAVKGGQRLAQLLQTSVLSEEFTANMTNVVLPLPVPTDSKAHELADLQSRFQNKLIDEWDCFVPVFVYEGKWWTRCSAQVYNEMADFDHVAKALSAICAEFRKEMGL
ncbi:PLP-dependent transferase [Hysterangium stoloniferum]|nr:PLP-dependent transferase [Hysterangium stoloniferum]